LSPIIDNPFAVFAIALVTQWGAAFTGDFLRRKIRPLKKDERADFDTVLAASLTLLALIIGFSFSMAVSRYDQRKNAEGAEANAIGTQYLRADLLPAEEATRVRQLLKTYVDQRINFYLGTDRADRTAGSDPVRVQNELWSTVVRAAAAQPNPVLALTVSGMNEIFNTQAETRPNRSVGSHGIDRNLLEFTARLPGSEQRQSGPTGAAVDHIHRVLPDCGY
jgi:hypothetical protein